MSFSSQDTVLHYDVPRLRPVTPQEASPRSWEVVFPRHGFRRCEQPPSQGVGCRESTGQMHWPGSHLTV